MNRPRGGRLDRAKVSEREGSLGMRYALVLVGAWIAVVSGIPVQAQESGGKPDLAKAQQIVNTVCAACHGADGNSPTPVNPSLAGQHAEYITLQLMHFKSGIRSNSVMAGMVANLTPEEMKSLGAFFAGQKPKGLAAKDPTLVSAGQKLYRGGSMASALPACAACHSPNGAGIPGRYPRLSGQYADYTLAQLQAFKAGMRGMDKDGKDVNGRVMAQIAGRMSEGEMRAVAEYTTGLH
jgi:cytochrome c553